VKHFTNYGNAMLEEDSEDSSDDSFFDVFYVIVGLDLKK
jgi:hypothetical protein